MLEAQLVRGVPDSENLYIGQFDKFFEEYCLLPIS
jgi:hypothetical protein